MAKEPERVWLCGGPDKARGGAAVGWPRRWRDLLVVIVLIAWGPHALVELWALIKGLV